MCDDTPLLPAVGTSPGLTRRRLGALSLGLGVMASLPRSANAVAVRESDIVVKTPDGEAESYLVHPSAGKAPGVILWVDVLGLRASYRNIAKRLAEEGYTVIAPNPYYRHAKLPVFPPELDQAAVLEKRTKLRATVTARTQAADAHAFTAFLDGHTATDTKAKLGTMGYCMGGAYTMHTAAERADRVGAAASFHGTRLVTDQPDSPHLLIRRLRASFLFCIAEDDDKAAPHAKDILTAGFAGQQLKAEIEVYAAQHGWCTPDSQAYNQAESERAWGRMLALFKQNLKPA